MDGPWLSPAALIIQIVLNCVHLYSNMHKMRGNLIMCCWEKTLLVHLHVKHGN